MPNQQFCEAVREALSGVPLESRKAWDESDLSRWFFAERSRNPALRRFDGDGDPWQHLKSICGDLVGHRASQ